jgi:hypothetical protein
MSLSVRVYIYIYAPFITFKEITILEATLSD